MPSWPAGRPYKIWAFQPSRLSPNADRNDSTQFTFLEISIPQHLVNDVLSLFAADCFQAACSRECSVCGTCD